MVGPHHSFTLITSFALSIDPQNTFFCGSRDSLNADSLHAGSFFPHSICLRYFFVCVCVCILRGIVHLPDKMIYRLCHV